MSECYQFLVSEENNGIICITPDGHAYPFELTSYKGVVDNPETTEQSVTARISLFDAVSVVTETTLTLDELLQKKGAPDITSFKQANWKGEEVTTQ